MSRKRARKVYISILGLGPMLTQDCAQTLARMTVRLAHIQTERETLRAEAEALALQIRDLDFALDNF